VTSDELARDYLRRARLRRQALDLFLSAGSWPDVVREAQEVAELILKGTLRFVGVDPPKRHDIEGALARFASRLPPEWAQALEELSDALKTLEEQRAPAFYGDEALGIPASELFAEADAQHAMTVVDRLLDLYTRLLGEQR
jgi:HEPN domain-containing protein